MSWILILAYMHAGEMRFEHFRFAQLPTCNASQQSYLEDFEAKSDAQLLIAECLPLSKKGLN